MYDVLRWSRQLQLGDMGIAVPSGFWLLASRAGVQWYVSCITAAVHTPQGPSAGLPVPLTLDWRGGGTRPWAGLGKLPAELRRN